MVNCLKLSITNAGISSLNLCGATVQYDAGCGCTKALFGPCLYSIRWTLLAKDDAGIYQQVTDSWHDKSLDSGTEQLAAHDAFPWNGGGGPTLNGLVDYEIIARFYQGSQLSPGYLITTANAYFRAANLTSC